MFVNISDSQILTVILILAIFVVIAIGAYLLKKYVPSLKSKDVEIDEEVAVREEIERIIVKVDDEVTKTAMDAYDGTKEPPQH